MELIVAEKPKVAEKIAMALSKNVEKKTLGGVSYYAGQSEDDEFFVAPAVGHVYTLSEKKKTNKYPAFDIEWVPSYEVSDEAQYTKGYVDVLKSLSKKADTFVSACDYDIEGSTIAYNVFRFATKIKEGKRMKFSALTQNDLIEAYQKRTDFDYNNAFAGETRHILDWYYGINLSRALMAAMRAASRYKVLSVGRVQGPALGLISQLEQQIRAFIPSPYWEISLKISDTEFMHVKGRFENESEAEAAYENTTDPSTITSIEKKEQIVPVLPPFDLTTLQVEAYRLFKYSPSKTLELAQNLYEASLITYPRTSSQKIPPSINVKKILGDLTSNTQYKGLLEKLLQKGWTKPIDGKKEDPAHPAIHPTGLLAKLDGPQLNLYDLITRRFLASCADVAKRERLRVEAKCGTELYASSGSRITHQGWTEFYGEYYTSEDVTLPEFIKGKNYPIADKSKVKKETKPPKRYTQASLVSELEDRHLGTKATRAGIIDTLFKRGYADGTNSIEVTDFGIKVSQVLQKYAPEILDENLTRKIEDDMEGIQQGKIDKDVVLKEGKEFLTQILDRWKPNEAKIGNELLDALKVTLERENLVGPCDKCGKHLRIIRMGGGRQFIGCSGYPNCRNAYPLPHGAMVKPLEKECPSCKKPTVAVKRLKSRFNMCIDPACPSKESWKKKVETNETTAKRN